MTDPGHILLIGGEAPVPPDGRATLEELRSVKELSAGLEPSPDDVESADLVVLTEAAVGANPLVVPGLRGLTDAPLLLLRERPDEIPARREDFDDAALVLDDSDLSRRTELLLAFRDTWNRAIELGVTTEDLEEELALYGLDPRLAGPRGLSPPGRVSLEHLVDVEMVTRQQLAICRMMGTAHGTFVYAAEARGLSRDGEEAPPTGALSPYCAYLSAQGRRCLESEFGAAREALVSGAVVEKPCAGGIALFAVPVCLTFHGLVYPLYAAIVAVGGVPGEQVTDAVAEKYGVNPEILRQMAVESGFWVLNPDKGEEIKRTITNLAEGISREMSHKYATAFQLFRGLLTEREIIRSERELEETNRRLKQKNEEVYERTHAITHDLKKPLSSMKAGLGLLCSGRLGELDEKQSLAADTSYEAVGYMQSLVEDLLEAARLDTGRKLIEIEDVALLPMLEKIRRRHKYQMDGCGVRLEFRDLPETVRADQGALEKVLMNLIGNAVAYIGDGEKLVTVSAEREDGGLVLAVEDTGMGIPEDSIAEAFEKFKRGSNVAGIRGTGLGLTIVEGLVKAHGGTVTIESEVGRGTRVAFTLPVEEARPDEEREEDLAGTPSGR